jgi:hypothetical protein
MKKIVCFIFMAILFLSNTYSQLLPGQTDFSRLPVLRPHYYEEYDSDTVVNNTAWQRVKPGMHVSFASSDAHYFRREVPEVENESLALSLTGWKGERLNAMILVWAPDTVSQVRFILNNLKTSNGIILDKRTVTINLIRYVISNYPYKEKKADCGPSPYKHGFLMPDRFESFERFDVPAKTVRPVWLSYNIPADAEAGIYEGTIEVLSTGYKSSLSVSITVQDMQLPAPDKWKYRLDLWQNPWSVAWYNHLEPWSPEHILLLKKHLKLYAEAGGKYITTYAVHSPWQDMSYMIEGGMIEWLKKENGNWEFDYKIFDEYVQLAIDAGIDKAITIYTPIPWNNRFRYMDEKTGNYVYELWPPESAIFKDCWNAFLTNLEAHLQKKGWFNKTYLGINEREMKQTLAAIKVIKDNSRLWKITYAGNWHKELDLLLDDYSLLYSYEPGNDDLKQRIARGQTTTFYVACMPSAPNNFVFSPPVEGRWMGWYAAASGYNGFLRWAYDAWPDDPERDARHSLWPAGDCFLVYPGGMSSIRFEKIREGIVDNEKILILRDMASKSKDKTVKKLIIDLETHLTGLKEESDHDKNNFDDTKITEILQEGIKIINELTSVINP